MIAPAPRNPIPVITPCIPRLGSPIGPAKVALIAVTMAAAPATSMWVRIPEAFAARSRSMPIAPPSAMAHKTINDSCICSLMSTLRMRAAISMLLDCVYSVLTVIYCLLYLSDTCILYLAVCRPSKQPAIFIDIDHARDPYGRYKIPCLVILLRACWRVVLTVLTMLLPYDDLFWPTVITHEPAKRVTAHKVAALAVDGDTIGAGSGSTAFLVLGSLASRVVREGLKISVVATSLECQWYAESFGLVVVKKLPATIDWAFDGTDEIDPQHNMIKGRGGALLRERQVLTVARRVIIAADSSKMVEQLGQVAPVPVEVAPGFARRFARQATKSDISFTLRKGAPGKDGPVITESGNLLFDCRLFGDAQDFENLVSSLPGVKATGLFLGFTVEVVI